MDRKGRNEGRRLGFWLEQSPVVLFFEKDSDLRSRSWKWRGPLCTWAFWEPYGTFKCRGGVVVPYRTQCITLPWVTLWLGYSFTLPRWPDSVASLENAGADWGAARVIWNMVGQTGFRGKEEPFHFGHLKRRTRPGLKEDSGILNSSLCSATLQKRLPILTLVCSPVKGRDWTKWAIS